MELELQEKIGTYSIFTQVGQTEHEQIVFCADKATGLKAIIAIHNTTLGPAAGGTRMWSYQNEADAVNDVLRLSRGMSFKNSIAGLNLGGGKAVIIGDARKDKSEAMMRRFGKFVDSLAGKYITAEDVGISTTDIEYIAMHTKHVAGKPEYMGGSGDPSPVTAYGVYMGMKASVKKVYGNDSLENKKIALQGIGNVGKNLLERLVKENAKVYVSDFYEDRLQDIIKQYPTVTAVNLEDIYDLDIDIYAPCALGATINDDTLSRLKCNIIAGGANNQLANEKIHGDLCKDKGILYAPDFLINGGGIINVYYEILDNYNRERALRHCEKIYDNTLKIYDLAQKDNTNTQTAAIKMAQERIDMMAKLNAVR
ncbi:MAG: Glu/Leu/Phe/Val dehydrogenase [Cytophagia bacterium]|nr:MAG: Glu/Leu/Phe/Val dehydrogenase [Cytophagia bacterium]TAG45286.1 MAG: Glu/Leu/Phe/Val dehydrogenase [Cytophagia bacterium]TAH31403.1 MAG: Glu/Leu/Phe/Val dehydrogenase [Cytophagales bacterium]